MHLSFLRYVHKERAGGGKKENISNEKTENLIVNPTNNEQMKVILLPPNLEEKYVKSMLCYICQLSFVTTMPSVRPLILSGKIF